LVRIPERKQSAAIQESLKLGNLKTKSAVDMLDQMCATYTVQRATRRWTMAVFYGKISIAAVNALVIVYAHNMRKVQPEEKIKRKDILLRIAHDLVTPFVTQRYKLFFAT
jgi:hypothetical protein